jgi:hypothetical protein
MLFQELKIGSRAAAAKHKVRKPGAALLLSSSAAAWCQQCFQAASSLLQASTRSIAA